MTITSAQFDQMRAKLRGEKVHVGRTNSSNTGKTFEAQIQESLDEYRRQGIMWGAKVDPPVRMAGGKVIFLANPWLDFSAVYTSQNGRAIHFEAKSTKTGRLPLARAGGITFKQVSTMMRLMAARAIVFVLWRIDEPKPMRTFLISGNVVMWLFDSQRVSIRPQDGFEVEPSVGFIPVPFEPVMRMAAL